MLGIFVSQVIMPQVTVGRNQNPVYFDIYCYKMLYALVAQSGMNNLWSTLDSILRSRFCGEAWGGSQGIYSADGVIRRMTMVRYWLTRAFASFALTSVGGLALLTGCCDDCDDARETACVGGDCNKVVTVEYPDRINANATYEVRTSVDPDRISIDARPLEDRELLVTNSVTRGVGIDGPDVAVGKAPANSDWYDEPLEPVVSTAVTQQMRDDNPDLYASFGRMREQYRAYSEGTNVTYDQQRAGIHGSIRVGGGTVGRGDTSISSGGMGGTAGSGGSTTIGSGSTSATVDISPPTQIESQQGPFGSGATQGTATAPGAEQSTIVTNPDGSAGPISGTTGMNQSTFSTGSNAGAGPSISSGNNNGVGTTVNTGVNTGINNNGQGTVTGPGTGAVGVGTTGGAGQGTGQTTGGNNVGLNQTSSDANPGVQTGGNVNTNNTQQTPGIGTTGPISGPGVGTSPFGGQGSFTGTQGGSSGVGGGSFGISTSPFGAPAGTQPGNPSGTPQFGNNSNVRPGLHRPPPIGIGSSGPGEGPTTFIIGPDGTSVSGQGTLLPQGPVQGTLPATPIPSPTTPVPAPPQNLPPVMADRPKAQSGVQNQNPFGQQNVSRNRTQQSGNPGFQFRGNVQTNQGGTVITRGQQQSGVQTGGGVQGRPGGTTSAGPGAAGSSGASGGGGASGAKGGGGGARGGGAR
jgi:hypothetical protein